MNKYVKMPPFNAIAAFLLSSTFAPLCVYCGELPHATPVRLGPTRFVKRPIMACLLEQSQSISSRLWNASHQPADCTIRLDFIQHVESPLSSSITLPFFQTAKQRYCSLPVMFPPGVSHQCPIVSRDGGDTASLAPQRPFHLLLQSVPN